MEGNSAYVTNLVNSIIGVSVLAMPFCFKQCGIVLGLGLLFGAAWLTYISCSMLATSAFHKRRRTYEYLALYTLGPTGKFTVELSMIGMMLGTCVAFYVVIGDLSNGILSKFVDSADPQTLRVFTIVFCGLCIALPLGLMKNLSVLSYFGFFSLLFYMAFVVVVVLNAVSNGLLTGDWFREVHLWRPAGIFQCLPIFSLAYACQCQLFIVYDSLEEPSVRRIENIVSHAIKFVTIVYMLVGFFGYTTYREHIAGNLLVSFSSNLLLDFIKLGFAMSVVLGFPLMIFPCRQSIHTLFFSKPAGEGLPPNTYIPPFLFKSITLVIVLSTMVVAIVIPNVETILGLTGATMGSIICFIFPALIYDKASPKGSGGIPKFVFAVGCLLLVVCTYSNLANTGQDAAKAMEHPIIKADEPPEVNVHDIDVNKPAAIEPVKEEDEPKEPSEEKEQPKVVAEVIDDEHRHEPANPIDPDNLQIKKNGEDSPDIKQLVDADANQEVKEVEANIKKDGAPGKQDTVLSPKIELPDVKPAEAKIEQQQPPPVVEGGHKAVEQPIDAERDKNVEDQVVPMEPVIDNDVKQPVNPGKIVIPLEKQNVRQPEEMDKGRRVDQVENQEPVDRHVVEQLESEKESVQGPPEGVDKAAAVEEDAGKEQQRLPGKQDVEQDPDAPQEKELLEKIKEQHEKQQQLLIEQEVLIKKLEEHQDKKDQVGEAKPSERPPLKAEVKEEGKGQGVGIREQLAPGDIDRGHPKIPLPENEINGGARQVNPKFDPQEKPPLDGLPALKVDGNALAGRELLSDQEESKEVKRNPAEPAKSNNEPVEAKEDQMEPAQAGDLEDSRQRAERSVDGDSLGVIKEDVDSSRQNAGDVALGVSPAETGDLKKASLSSSEKTNQDPDGPAEESRHDLSKEDAEKTIDKERLEDDMMRKDAEKKIEDCLDDDIECWEKMPKARELKSYQEVRNT